MRKRQGERAKGEGQLEGCLRCVRPVGLQRRKNAEGLSALFSLAIAFACATASSRPEEQIELVRLFHRRRRGKQKQRDVVCGCLRRCRLNNLCRREEESASGMWSGMRVSDAVSPSFLCDSSAFHVSSSSSSRVRVSDSDTACANGYQSCFLSTHKRL